MSRKAVIAVSAVVAIFAAAAALLIAGVGTATADEVRFQNVSDPGPAPFHNWLELMSAVEGRRPEAGMRRSGEAEPGPQEASTTNKENER